MSLFEKIKYYYDKGFYNKTHLVYFVQTNKITSKEYKDITGEEYPKN